jgi:methylmalonyl-CoA mutase, C-terminal domain
MQRKIRVLVGKPGLDGHDRGAKVVAAALRDAGMEVIYTGLHQTPEQIVEAAVQEDVDVVALSVLSGAHMTIFPEVGRLMAAAGIGEKLLTGGGIIPADDIAALYSQGTGRLFGPGSSTVDIVTYIRGWYAERFGADALPPLPPPPPRPQPVLGSGPTPARAASVLDAHHARAAARPAKRAPKKAPKKAAKEAAKKRAPKPRTKPARPLKAAKKVARKPAKKAAKKAARRVAPRKAAGKRPAKKRAAGRGARTR